MSSREHNESQDASVDAAFDPAQIAGAAGTSDDPTHSAEGGRRKEADRRPSQNSAEDRKDGGRLSRITGETRGLVEDLKEWVDLKIQLLQLDFEDRIRQAANQAALTAVVVVIALLAVLFALVAAGEALGAWFDSRSLGFLALAGILAVIAGLIHALKPRLVEKASTDDKADVAAKQLQKGTRQTSALPEPASADSRGAGSTNDTKSDDHR